MAGQIEEDYSEYRLALPDGRVRHLAVSATRTDWAGRAAMLGVFHDISRQRAAMAALRGSEERYRTMIEALSEGVLIFDEQARVKGANRGGRAAAGRLVRGTAPPRLPDWQAFDADATGSAARRLPVAIALATGKPVRHALLGMHLADGGVRWLEVNSEPLRDGSNVVTGVLVSLTDVTDRVAWKRRCA